MSEARYFLHNVPLPEALARWEADRRAAGCPERVDTVTVSVADALGRVLAEPVWARRSSPAYDAAAMDGIAVRSPETIGASETSPLWLGPGSYVPVDTGDPLPDGYDAVIMREHVHFEGDRVELRAAATPYQHVRSLGEDVTETELLLPEGRRLGAVDLAAAAAAGCTELCVRRTPLVAILPTGDEIVPLGQAQSAGQIEDTNSLMLAAQAREVGAEPLVCAISPDDPSLLAASLRQAAEGADLVLVVAGSSAGRDDHTASVIAAEGMLSAHGIAVKPGHPVVLGVVLGTPVIGVPGYPVSAALTFDLIARPLLASLEGTAPFRRPRARARLARKLASTMGVEDWVRVRLGRVGSTLVAAPLARGAGVLTSLVRADALLCVPASLEGHEAGEEIEAELLRPLEEIEQTVLAIGSHDLVLDLAASWLRRRNPNATLASSNVGSLGGLTALRDGLCHLAGSHLLDPRSGEYTLPYVDRVLAGIDVAVIRLVRREQGLIVPPGNPLGLRGIGDLARPGLRYVNRQRGAGTRALLDHELGQRGIDPRHISGYDREEHTHLAVAAAVAAGRADCGLGIRAAAKAFRLDFVPVAFEPYDLVLRSETLTEPMLAPLLALLEDPAFRGAVEALGGYDPSEMGRRIR